MRRDEHNAHLMVNATSPHGQLGAKRELLTPSCTGLTENSSDSTPESPQPTSMSKSQGGSVSSEKRVSQWEALMRKFSAAHKEECKSVSVDIPRVPRTIKQFPTGSQYEGTWDILGMSGNGTYTFSNGVIYEGEFNDGMFHGRGELRYPSGEKLRGQWRRGLLIERTLVFADGLEYSDHDWKYCLMPDRRFTIEYNKGLKPTGLSYLTADQPTRKIPDGFYDTGDGFYDPTTKVVYNADDMISILRHPSLLEQKWIIENCRTAPDMVVGPRSSLYEEWLKPSLGPDKVPHADSTCSMEAEENENTRESRVSSSTYKHHKIFFN